MDFNHMIDIVANPIRKLLDFLRLPVRKYTE